MPPSISNGHANAPHGVAIHQSPSAGSGGGLASAFPLKDVKQAATESAGSPKLEIANWNMSVFTRPAKVVIARDIAHVQEVVRDIATYPTPVSVVGSMHSVNECLVNDGGTLLCTSALDGVLGMVGGGEVRLVKVQAGCKLAKLHKWLAERDSELSFSPEIGDATVGSLVTTTSKDSSLAGLGYLSALVYDVSYVDEAGELVHLNRERDEEALGHFTCSNGLMGVVVEATLEARPLAAIRTQLHVLPVNDQLARRLLKLKSKSDNMFAIISTHGFAYVEQRFAKTMFGRKKTLPGWNWFTRLVARIKYGAFLRGAMSRALGGLVLLEPLMRFTPALHYRHEFVNSYPAVSASEPRLDFTFYEFPLERFSEVVCGMRGQAEAFHAETGFKPAGMAMYFVTRPGTKPCGSFSGPPGTSFMLDPFHGDPQEPRWLQFLERINDWAVQHGAHVSPTQTKLVRPRHYKLDARYARQRFTSPYYAQFIQAGAE